MGTTGLDVFDKTLQTTNIWPDEIMEAVGPDRGLAWHVLGAVLRACVIGCHWVSLCISERNYRVLFVAPIMTSFNPVARSSESAARTNSPLTLVPSLARPDRSTSGLPRKAYSPCSVGMFRRGWAKK